MCPVLQLPDLKDAEAVQKFFLEEIQQGEELLAQGKASSTPPWHPLRGGVLTVLALRLQETMREAWTT